MKRIIAAILALLILASAFTGCSEAENKPVSHDENDAAENSTEQTSAETTDSKRAAAKDSLPSDLDFGGAKVTILARGGAKDNLVEFAAEESTGDIVSDAIYNRNLLVMERLNVNIGVSYSTDTRHEGTNLNDIIKNTVLSGDSTYDFAANHMSQSTPLILQGYLTNLHSLDYLDFDRPWWNSSFKEQLTINNKLYLAVGELSISLMQGDYVCFFNKDIFNNYYNGDDLYQIVLDGEWTFEKLQKYMDGVYSDLNGNGEADNGDLVGFAFNTNKNTILADGFLGAANVQYTAKDNNGIPYFVIESEHTYTFVDKLNTIFNHKSIYNAMSDEAHWQYFIDGNALFTSYLLLLTESMRDMEQDYGIIPLPKLNEEQENYTGNTHNGFSAVFMPTTGVQKNMTAAVIEAMCAETYRSVTECYYEIALKNKYSRDDVTNQMLDIITSSVYFDFAMVYAASLDSVYQIFRTMFASNPPQASSVIAKKLITAETKLAELLSTYETLE